MQAFSLPTKDVAFGTLGMTLPATWGFERQEDGQWWWGDPSGHPGALIVQDERPVDLAAGGNAERVQPIVEEFHGVFRDLEGVRSFDVIPHAAGAVMRVTFDDDPGGIWEIRWYTAMVAEAESVAALLRIRLILTSAHRGTPLAIALEDLFHNQALGARVETQPEPHPDAPPDAHRGDPVDRAPLPPDGFYRPLRRATFDGLVTCNLPLAWTVRPDGASYWWCRNDQYMGALYVTHEWVPADLADIDVPTSLAASVETSVENQAQGRGDGAIDLQRSDSTAIACAAFDQEDRPGDGGDEGDGGDGPLRQHVWRLARAVEGGILFAGFNLMFPRAHADAPVYRQLVEDMDLSVRTAALAPPGPQPRPPLQDSDRRFDMNFLRAHTCYDFINICVPRRWIWEQSDGAWGFFPRDGTDNSGVLWVDHDFLSAGEEVPRDRAVTAARRARDRAAARFAGEFGAHVVIRSEDIDEGGILWITHDSEEDGEELRFHRCHRFLARKRGVLILHFNLVLLESQADEPGTVELVRTVTREIEAARVL